MAFPLRVASSLLALLLLAGCGTGSGEGAAAEPSGASTPTSSAPVPDREPRTEGGTPTGVPASLDFTGTTVSGEQLQGASLAGTPTLLWFWAPWCPTCRSQVPQVERLASRYAGELDVVGIGSLDSADAIAEFAGDVEGVTQLEDTEGELWKRFGVTEQSSFVLLDGAGETVFETGYGGSDDLDDRVADVVG